MRKIAEQIVKKRILILVLATVLLVPSLIGYINTRINYDILSYLPDQLDSIEGQDILDQEFHSASMAIVTVENMEKKQVDRIADKIRAIDGVRDAMWLGDFLQTMPSEMIPEDLRGMLDNGDCQLMMVTFEEGNGSDRTLKAVDEIKSLMNSQMFLGGLAAVINDTKMLIEQELPLYVAVGIAVVCAGIVAAVLISRQLQNTQAQTQKQKDEKSAYHRKKGGK